MMKNNDDSDYTLAASSQEEMHCSKCGSYLGLYGPGSYAIVPCPKCKEPTLIDFTGAGPVVKRNRKRQKT